MDEQDAGEWDGLAARLSAYARTMINGDELVLHVPGEPAEEVIISVPRAGRLRVDVPWSSDQVDLFGDHELYDRGDADVMGVDVASQLRDTCGLPHPSLLTVSADGPAACGLAVLRLTTTDRVFTDRVADDGRPPIRAVMPTDPAALLAAVVAHIVEQYDPDAEPDEDEDVLVVLDGIAMWVQVLPDQPAVRVFAPVLDGVRSRRQADAELNVLNRSDSFSRWVRRDRDITQELVIPALPFVGKHLDHMLRAFAGAYAPTRDDLVDRLRTEVSS